MATPFGERAISDCVRVGKAILKFISPNDVGLTGSHQTGYYLPKAVWQIFAQFGPIRGRNDTAIVSVTWQDDRITDSRVKWYGTGTRSEYRLTRFGRDFPYLTADCVGQLLVLIPEDHFHFLAYVLDIEEDIEEIEATLGVELTKSWAAFDNGQPVAEPEDENHCIERRFRRFVEALDVFPSGRIFSEMTQASLIACSNGFEDLCSDDLLLRCMEAEYRLFRLAERQVCSRDIIRVFKDVDDFLATASSIMNRRKSRAGRSLENHVEYLLRKWRIPHAMRPNIDGKPDVVIPSAEAYHDQQFPLDRLVVMGIKTTCKDRWRQILQEAPRVPRKHILTMQHGISPKQLTEMHRAGVTLVVPFEIKREYPSTTEITLLSVEQFLESVRQILPQ